MFARRMGWLVFLVLTGCVYRVQGVPVKEGEAGDSVDMKKAIYECRREVEQTMKDRWAVGMIQAHRLSSERELMYHHCMEAKGYAFG